MDDIMEVSIKGKLTNSEKEGWRLRGEGLNFGGEVFDVIDDILSIEGKQLKATVGDEIEIIVKIKKAQPEDRTNGSV